MYSTIHTLLQNSTLPDKGQVVQFDEINQKEAGQQEGLPEGPAPTGPEHCWCREVKNGAEQYRMFRCSEEHCGAVMTFNFNMFLA